MRHLGMGSFARGAGFLALGLAVFAIGTATAAKKARAQIKDGDYWLYQPQQSTPVGRAYSNADHTAEYWAYVDGEYRFADTTNIPVNPWHLNAALASTTDYTSYASFKTAVLARAEFQGKTIVFQNHSVSEETVQN
jgi:hypothetical protein